MGIVAELVELVNATYKAWRDWRGGSSISPQELYSKYVAPSYQLLREVHSDYLVLYIELQERIDIGDPLIEIARWFSQARLRRQVDRSELRALELPPVEGRAQHVADIDSAGLEYLRAVREYFLPVRNVKGRSFEGRLRSLEPSRARETDRRLLLMLQWDNLTLEDQRAVAAEEFYDKLPYFADRFGHIAELGGLLDASSGNSVPSEVQELLASNATGAEQALQKLEAGDLPKALRSREPSKYVSWKHILEDHIRDQRWSLEWAISDVQRKYIRLRLLVDRA